MALRIRVNISAIGSVTVNVAPFSHNTLVTSLIFLRPESYRQVPVPGSKSDINQIYAYKREAAHIRDTYYVAVLCTWEFASTLQFPTS